jgi:hypothetical protein
MSNMLDNSNEGAERMKAIFRNWSPGACRESTVQKLHESPGLFVRCRVSNFRTICFPTSAQRTPETLQCSPY